MRLLVAEDEEALARALTAILQKSNYEADAVGDGASALEYLCSGNYDGAILDVMLPAPDGIEVLRRVRSRGIDVPVLLLTGWTAARTTT